MPGITQGAAPITGVYVRGQLATGLYVGQKAIWPTAILGMSHMGVGMFELRGCALLAESDSTIRINPRLLAFTGAPLQSAITQALRVDLSPGTTAFGARSTDLVADAKPPLAVGTLDFTGDAPALVSGHVIPAVTGSLTFTGAALLKQSGNELAVNLQAGTLAFTPIAATASAAWHATSGVGSFAFTGAAPSVAMGSALSVSLSPSALAFTAAALGAEAALSLAASPSALALTGCVLYPPADVVVSVAAGQLSVWGHYTTVDTSPFALRLVGTRTMTSISGVQQTQVLLPAGASPGDTAFIARPGPQRGDEIAPTGATTLASSQLTLYQTTLTAADIANGYVITQTDGVYPFAVEVFSGADSTLDALGTYTSTTSPAAVSASANVAGVTLTRPGSIPLVAMASTNASAAWPTPTAPWFTQTWRSIANTGAGLFTEAAPGPGAISDITCGYGIALTSNTSIAGTVMMTVRPLYVNAQVAVAAGALSLSGAACTTAYSDPNVSLPVGAGTVSLVRAQLQGNQDTPQVQQVGQNVVYSTSAGPTQLPLPSGTQAGDYAFVNVGVASYDPNNPPLVPPDSQAFIAAGVNGRIAAYWVPIIPYDIGRGYIEIDARASASFTYIVYRGAGRQLQAIGALNDVSVAASLGHATLNAPGIDVASTSGAALIAFSTTDATDPSITNEAYIAAAGWSGPFATGALVYGGIRAGILALDPQLARSVPDTTVTYTPAQGTQVKMDAQMFAIQPGTINAVLALAPARVALQPGALVIEALTTSGDVQIGIPPEALALTGEALDAVAVFNGNSAVDLGVGSMPFTGRQVVVPGQIVVPVIVQKVPYSTATTQPTVPLTFAAPTPGNMLVAALVSDISTSGGYAFLTPDGWTPYITPYQSSSQGYVGPQVYIRTADGTETSVTFTRKDGFNKESAAAFFEVGGIPGGVAISGASKAIGTHSSGVVDFASITPTAPNALALAMCGWAGFGQAPNFSIAAGWTTQTTSDLNLWDQLMTATQQQDASLAPVTGWMQQSTAYNTHFSEHGTVTLLFGPAPGLPATLGAGSVAFSSMALQFTGPFAANPGAGAIAFAGQALSAVVSSTGQASTDMGAGSVALGGVAASVKADVTASMGAGTMTLTGKALALPATGVTLVNVGSSANSSSSAISMSVPITASAGDTILAVLSVRQGATNTGPAGFTLLDDYIAVSSASLSEFLIYKKTADGTETSVDATSTRSFNGAALQVWKIPGGANVQTFQGGRGGSGATTAWSVGPFTPTNANATVIALWSNGSATTEGTYGVDAAWSNFTVVDSSTGSNIGTASIGWATQQQTTATAATANFTAAGTGLQSPTDYMIAVSK